MNTVLRSCLLPQISLEKKGGSAGTGSAALIGDSDEFFRCKWFLGKNGQLVKFTAKDADALVRNVIEPMASDGLRTICLAYKDYVPAGGQVGENQVILLIRVLRVFV